MQAFSGYYLTETDIFNTNQIIRNILFCFSISFVHATFVAKSYRFAFSYVTICLLVSGTLRFISLLKLSEEAGVQCLGSDLDGIWKVRILAISISSLISLIFLDTSTTFQQLFYPDEIGPVKVNHFILLCNVNNQ